MTVLRRARRPAEHLDRRAPGALAAGSRTWASTGSRSGTTSTRRPRPTSASASRRWRRTPRSPATRAACAAARSCTRVGYRHPAVLANAICDDRPAERRAGRPRPRRGLERRSSTTPTASRSRPIRCGMDQLEEAIQCVRGLLRDEIADVRGRVVRAARRALRPEAGAGAAADLDRRRRREAHAAHRRAVGRRLERPVRRSRRRSRTSARCCSDTAPTSDAIPPRSARRSTSGSRGRRRACERSSAGSPTASDPGVLGGTDEEVLDRIGEYVDAGADQVNLALRAPFDDRRARAARRSALPLLIDRC